MRACVRACVCVCASARGLHACVYVLRERERSYEWAGVFANVSELWLYPSVSFSGFVKEMAKRHQKSQSVTHRLEVVVEADCGYL